MLKPIEDKFDLLRTITYENITNNTSKNFRLHSEIVRSDRMIYRLVILASKEMMGIKQ